MIWGFELPKSRFLFAPILTLATCHVVAAADVRPNLWERATGTPQVVARDQVPPELPPAFPPRQHGAHFGPPTRSYSAFESPTSYGTHPVERCRPEVFSPRGIGVARRSGCERMDYSPYVLSTTRSNHGPSYYTRHSLAPCTHPHCNH